MADKTSTLAVRLIDGVTAPARAASRAIAGIGTAVDTTNGRRLAIAGALSRMSADVSRATADLARNLNRMSAAFALPVGAAAFFGARSVYDFEKFKNTMAAVTGMTDQETESVKRLAMALNATVPFDAAEIMSAAVELGKAGFDYNKIVGTLGTTLNLAAAGGLELSDAAEISVNVLTAMRLPMQTIQQSQASLTRVADVLSYAANASTTDVRLMGETFKYVGPIAAASGMSIEDVAAAAIVMANNGTKGAEAGVALRSALVRMVRPTKPMIAALARLNVSLADFVKSGRQITAMDVIASLNASGIDASPFKAQIEAALKNKKLRKSLSAMTARLTEIIAGDGSVLDKATLAENISDALTAAGSEIDFKGFIKALREKGATMADIVNVFDARQGSRLQAVLAGDLLGTLEDVQKNAPGSTDKTRAVMMQGVVGDWAALKASMQNLFLAIADAGVLKAATGAIQAMTGALKWLAELSPAMLKFGTYSLLAMAALGPLGLLLGGFVGFLKSIAALFRIISGFSKGVIAVFRVAARTSAAAAGTGAGAVAGTGAGAAAGVGAGAAAAAGKGGLFRLLMRGAGAIGAGLMVNDLLNATDSGGNLWGLTAGIDRWAEKHLGFNPSKIGGGSREPDAAPTTAEALDELNARMAAVNARLEQIAANTHPAMRDAPNPERDRLEGERVTLQSEIDDLTPKGQPDAAAAAASETLDAYRRAWAEQFPGLRREVEAQVRELMNIMNFTARPTIRPRIEGSALRAVHADIGVE